MYPGSFDLLTNGHMDLIERAHGLFDELYIGVGVNPRKKDWLFSIEERLSIIQECTHQWPNVKPRKMEGLTVQFAREIGARFIIRGLRAVSDFEFELQLALMNRRVEPGVETIFLPSEARHIFLSSSMIRDIWRHGGDIAEFVPPQVLVALRKKQRH